jgi:hypothetical protein
MLSRYTHRRHEGIERRRSKQRQAYDDDQECAATDHVERQSPQDGNGTTV